MIDTLKGPERMDHPEVIARLFFPRPAQARETSEAFNRPVQVDEGVHIVCRVFPSRDDGPNLLFFHGNGETAPDYDYVAPFYRKAFINLFVADFRGYGMSNGSPSCSGIIRDARPIYHSFASFIEEKQYTGGLYVMGRSLGSAPAIEVAYHYQQRLKGLIVESGFASSRNQFARLGVAHLFRDIEDPVGFCNDIKIKEIHIPTLIIHGEADQIIPVEEGKALYELSNARHKTTFFVPYAGHNDLMEQSLSEYMGSIVRFMDSGQANDRRK
jgi:pimeloyl-ACP methyl ester carboxylesterase